MTVYIVIDGDCSAYSSDYNIEGAFSTRELAEKFSAELKLSDGFAETDIIELIVDEKSSYAARKVFYADIDMVPKLHYCVEYSYGYDITCSSAISQEHANNLVEEARKEYLREEASEPRVFPTVPDKELP